MKVKGAIVFSTSNAPALREQEVFGDPLERIWRDCIFSLCGMPVFHRKVFRVIVTSTEEERRAWLGEVQDIVQGTFPPGSP